MVNYASAFSQSESGKYFEWIIMGLKAGLRGDPLVIYAAIVSYSVFKKSFVKAEQEKEPLKLVNVSFYCSMIVTAKQHNYSLQPK